MQVKPEQIQEGGSACGCGRSPTGRCIGWHGLTEEQYWDRLKQYNEGQMSTRVIGVDETYG